MISMSKLKEWRLKKRYSQKELATLIGCNQANFSVLERGKIKMTPRIKANLIAQSCPTEVLEKYGQSA